MGVMAERLLERLTRAREWPPLIERDVWAQIALYVALRESDRDYLQRHIDWDIGRDYIVDPLPPMIPSAFSSLIFGRLPDVTAANEADQPNVDRIVEENQLQAELQRAEMTCSSEGEVWWRLFVDPDVADVPLIQWHSRLGVIPMFVGSRLVAAAFVSRLDPLTNDDNEAWRWLEIHDATDVVNVLFRGFERDLGDRRPLAAHPDTSFLRETWAHGLPSMPSGRIVNKLGVDPTIGISDYDGISDFLLALNETASIGQENARLTAKARVIVPPSAVDDAGNIPAGKEVLVASETDEDLGKTPGASSQFKVLEYRFQAQELIAYANDLAAKALSRVGITPQFVGLPAGTEGLAQSGTALRLRLVPSVNAGDDRAQFWDPALPKMMMLTQLLDAAPPDSQGQGGFGRPYQAATERPGVRRGASLPEDPIEETARHAQAVEAQIEARRTAVEALHPDWDQARVDAEIKLLESEAKLFGAAPASTLFSLSAGDHPSGGEPALDGTGANGAGAGAASGAAAA